MQGPAGVADEFVQHRAGAAEYVEYGTVDELNADLTIGRSLNDVALANRIANLDLNDGAAGPRQGARTEYRLNMADNRGRSAHRPVASRAILVTRRVAQATRHGTPTPPFSASRRVSL